MRLHVGAGGLDAGPGCFELLGGRGPSVEDGGQVLDRGEVDVLEQLLPGRGVGQRDVQPVHCPVFVRYVPLLWSCPECQSSAKGSVAEALVRAEARAP